MNMNDNLLILFGFIFLAWGGIEFILDKAYVRTEERWVFKWIQKKEHPVRYWFSVALKCGAGTFILLTWVSQLIRG